MKWACDVADKSRLTCFEVLANLRNEPILREIDRQNRLKQAQIKYKSANREIIQERHVEYLHNNPEQQLKSKIRAYLSKLNLGRMDGTDDKKDEYKIYEIDGRYYSKLFI